MKPKQFAARSKRDLPEGQELIVRHCAIALGAYHRQGGSVRDPVATLMTLSCSEVDSWVVYGETDGFIARWSSDYPSILVQRQGIQQQKVPRVMQTLDEGCCKCGRVDVACVPKTKIPSSFG